MAAHVSYNNHQRNGVIMACRLANQLAAMAINVAKYSAGESGAGVEENRKYQLIEESNINEKLKMKWQYHQLI
jgi:hypothetical protein